MTSSWGIPIDIVLRQRTNCVVACILFMHQAVAQQVEIPAHNNIDSISESDSAWIDAVIDASIEDVLMSEAPGNGLEFNQANRTEYESFQASAFENDRDAVSRWYDAKGTNASLSFVSGDRRGETVSVFGEKLGTGVLNGFRFDFRNRQDAPNRSHDGWSGSLFHISGEDESSFSNFAYRASLTSGDANAMVVSHYKNRLRRISGGIRAVLQEDSYVLGPTRVESTNRMIGPQIGIEQSWHSPSAFAVGFAMKSAALYNYATRASEFSEQVSHRFPILLECSAKAVYRFSESGEIDLGIGGMSISEQQFAVDAGDETSSVRYLTMSLGLRYQF